MNVFHWVQIALVLIMTVSTINQIYRDNLNVAEEYRAKTWPAYVITVIYIGLVILSAYH